MTEIRNTFDRVRLPARVDDRSRTKQAFQDECDINNIMAKFRQTGLVEHVSRWQGEYGECPSEPDLQTSLEVIRKAEEAFASLPAHVRKRFDNEPAKFLAFVHTPGNEAELRNLGLLPNPDEQMAPAQPEPPAEAVASEPAT